MSRRRSSSTFVVDVVPRNSHRPSKNNNRGCGGGDWQKRMTTTAWPADRASSQLLSLIIRVCVRATKHILSTSSAWLEPFIYLLFPAGLKNALVLINPAMVSRIMTFYLPLVERALENNNTKLSLCAYYTPHFHRFLSFTKTQSWSFCSELQSCQPSNTGESWPGWPAGTDDNDEVEEFSWN